MENLKWRLSKLPTVEELTLLEEKKILTKEEVKKILFNNETETDKKSLESEIEFLRKVINNLSDRESIRTVVIQYLPNYITQPFYQPYYYWASPNAVNCSVDAYTTGYCGTTTLTTATNCDTGSYTTINMSDNFTDIKTF